ncbi:MAG: tyrosine-type recombinase/integrase [Lachnospiraceae bacterium]|nr:tyrosine-type recombinase/integrase [Lachnospiraceae bacterium]
MAKRRRYPRLPNGYGSIKKLSGKNRTNPYGVYPPVKEFDINGIPVPQKAICYVDDWYKGFTVLTWYKNGDYYPGREAELTDRDGKLHDQVLSILSKFNQNQREESNSKTFSNIFEEFYLDKFKKSYGHSGKKSSMEYSMSAAYKNCKELHNSSFRSISSSDMQDIIDNCALKHSSLELIMILFHQMYAYAEKNDLVEKDYSRFVKIGKEDDDEHGIPFTDEELKILWDNKMDATVEMILIMCYSGFRISAYLDITTNLEEKYFQGGVKTKAGKDRIVPIHSAILPLVEHRLNDLGAYIKSDNNFRLEMYKKLEQLKIEKHTPHDCRHTFSMLCDKYGVNENDKKGMLGHAFQDVTNKVYRHRNLKDLIVQIEKITV